MPAVDYKKDYRDLYLPKVTPAAVDVPEMTFIMINGAGDPNGEIYDEAVRTLYALSYAIKMKGKGLPGYYDYVVFPLEGLWWVTDANFYFNERSNWLWTAMIRQPEFVTPEVFDWAKELCAKTKPENDYSKARLGNFAEGLCVQALHIGPYADEPETVRRIREYMEANGFSDETGLERKHHEIYLADPRKTEPEKLKTVLRHPVGRI